VTQDPYTIDHLSQDPLDSPDAATVEAVARDYIEGWHEGDAQRMERTLHDDLVKRGIEEDAPAPSALSRVTKTQMVQLTRDGGGRSPDAGAQVVVHHVEGGIASVHVATDEYLDCLHLAKTGGTWRIVHDLFRERN
jgi:hypothetical protein